MTQASTIERYCISCGTERQVHIETGRCQTCGRSTAHSEALPLNGATTAQVHPDWVRPPAAQPAEKLVLPETPGVRRWVQQTKALADTFGERAEKSERFAERFQSEALTLARAARAFAGLLAQIGIESPPPKQPRGPLRLPPGQWSRAHERCLKCQRTDRKHKANGVLHCLPSQQAVQRRF